MSMKNLRAESVTIIKLSQASEACKDLMNTERQEGVRNTPLFLGPPGQGKSAIVEQFVNNLNLEREERFATAIAAGKTSTEAAEVAGPEWTCVSYRLAQCDPTDLKGVPVYVKMENGAEMCSFAPPQIFPMIGLPDSAGGKNVVIFLDELPQANPTIQNLAANIIDGKVGDYIIDMSRSFIVCAGNRKQDHAATYDIPRNVGNRLIRFDVRTSFDEWERWAMGEKLHPMVIGFLKDKQSMFNEPPPEEGYIYGTPRSWHKVSCQMKYMVDRWFDEQSLGLYLAQGTVGIASATAFYQFAKAMKNQFSVDDIMAGKAVRVPTTEQRDILFSLVLEATYRINNWVEEVVSSNEYKIVPHTETMTRVDAMIKGLGDKRVTGIVNMYKWLDNKAIDPAFQVLINKYQTELTRDNLRIAIMLDPKFSNAADAYEKINSALVTMR